MEKLKIHFKKQCLISLSVLMVMTAMIFINQIVLKQEMRSFAEHSRLLSFIRTNTQYDFKHLGEFLLTLMRIKDIVISILTLIVLLIFTLIHRSVLKTTYGLVKIGMMGACLVVLAGFFFVDGYLMDLMGVSSNVVTLEQTLRWITLSILVVSFILFIKKYVAFRKSQSMSFFSRESLWRFAFKAILYSGILLFIVLFVMIGITVVCALVSKQLIQQFDLSRYLGDEYGIDIASLVNQSPHVVQEFIEKMPNYQLFMSQEGGIVHINVSQLDAQVQQYLFNKVQELFWNRITFLVQLVIFYSIVNGLNIWYKRSKFNYNVPIYIILGMMILKRLFFSQEMAIVYMTDSFIALAIMLYSIDIINRERFEGQLKPRFQNKCRQIYATIISKLALKFKK